MLPLYALCMMVFAIGSVGIVMVWPYAWAASITYTPGITCYGTNGDDVMKGNNGENIMHGFVGNDQLTGGSGNDWMFGEQGDDKLFGIEGNDRIRGQQGNDGILETLVTT
jgi:Ca2+-binding RTX toxin-like protein